MKKIAVLTFALCILTSAAQAYEIRQEGTEGATIRVVTKEEQVKLFKAREAAFEQKLGLTEEQKVQIRVLREQGHAKMKPIMDQLRAKRQEAEMVKMSRIAVEAQEEKLAEIDKEIKELEKQLHVYRRSNMKEFESILTAKQKRILKNMKKEGRKKFEQNHRPHHSV